MKKNNKPKGKTPSLIGSTNGKPEKIIVQKKSICKRCSDAIEIDQECFGIPKIGSGFRKIHRYCKPCFLKIITQTEKDIEEIKKSLNS